VRLHLILRCDFLRFQISEKMDEFAASIERSKAKNVSASLPLDAEGSTPDPRYKLVLCTLTMPPCQILNTPLTECVLLLRVSRSIPSRTTDQNLYDALRPNCISAMVTNNRLRTFANALSSASISDSFFPYKQDC